MRVGNSVRYRNDDNLNLRAIITKLHPDQSADLIVVYPDGSDVRRTKVPHIEGRIKEEEETVVVDKRHNLTETRIVRRRQPGEHWM